jgi:hypothetical protein
MRMGLILAFLFIPACTSMTSADSKHVGAGMATGFVVYAATDSPLYACAASIAVGLAKEGYDATGRGHATASDVLYTAVPSCAFYYGIDMVKRWRAERLQAARRNQARE